MKNAKTYTILSWFTFLLTLLLMTGCSTRKVATTKVIKENSIEKLETEKKDLEVKENSNVKVTIDIAQTEETTTEKKTYSPIDPTKPGVFTDDKGNKKELNNTSYTEEKTISKTNKKGITKADLLTAKTTNDKTVKSNKTKVKSKEATKVKHTTRSSFIWPCALLIAIALYLLWKYRKSILKLIK